ncbi:MAG TPA: polysaccharide deacetylase family protein [Solirubrobacterales bacterium]|nr:polysaccharide deacetylase family protein [Solirubrobacterales bacterium]
MSAGAPAPSQEPRFSIVVPTHQRRDRVVHNVEALARQELSSFEVIVVVDGSSDGSADALRALQTPFPLTVIEQANSGAAAARNVGARAAAGAILLFLDDDMEAHPRMLAEHERSHREGADLVVGDMPLHPDSPQNLLSWGVGFWAESRRERLTSPGAEVTSDDLLTGQMSISRSNFGRLGGFDGSFTREGMFGGEDIDFGLRVVKAGLFVAYNPEAISYQYYDVDPAAYLRRTREAGRSEEELVLKHPEQSGRLDEGPAFHTRRSRWLLGPLAAAPEAISWPLRAAAVALVRSGRRETWVRRFFFGLRTMEHQRGVRQAREAAAGDDAVAILAYHAVSDLGDDPVLAEYGIPAARLAEQLDALAAHGWNFVDLDAVLAAFEGRGTLPRRAALVTFDDCYVDLLSEGLPVLRERGVPALAFAVAGLTGAANEWDRPLGARELPLLDGDGLRQLAEAGIEIGSHAMTHRPLARLEPEEATKEVAESAQLLESLGLPRPRALSYPHGETNAAVETAAAEAGYLAAFTVDPGIADRSRNRLALPRIEVLASDSLRTLRVKLATARWPARWRELALRATRLLP